MGWVGDDRAKATRGEGAAVRSHNQKPKNQGSVDIFVHTPFRKASLDTLVHTMHCGDQSLEPAIPPSQEPGCGHSRPHLALPDSRLQHSPLSGALCVHALTRSMFFDIIVRTPLSGRHWGVDTLVHTFLRRPYVHVNYRTCTGNSEEE